MGQVAFAMRLVGIGQVERDGRGRTFLAEGENVLKSPSGDVPGMFWDCQESSLVGA